MTKDKDTALQRRAFWGRALLIFAIAAWMFIIGVMVGRGTAPVRFDIQALQKELAQLRSSRLEKKRKDAEKTFLGKDREASMEFYEALKRDGLDTSVEIPATPKQGTDPIPPLQGSEASTVPHKTKSAALLQKGSRIANKQTRSASTTSASKSQSGDLTIQVASLKDGTAAGRIVANLKKEGYSAYLSRIVIPDKGLWFRVRVGSYTSQKQAAADMDRLTKNKKKPILLAK